VGCILSPASRADFINELLRQEIIALEGEKKAVLQPGKERATVRMRIEKSVGTRG
jgi:hypothetical protein